MVPGGSDDRGPRVRIAPEVEGCEALRALATRGSGEALYSSPSEVRGGAPAVNDFERVLIELSIQNVQFEELFVCCQHSSIQHTHIKSDFVVMGPYCVVVMCVDDM